MEKEQVLQNTRLQDDLQDALDNVAHQRNLCLEAEGKFAELEPKWKMLKKKFKALKDKDDAAMSSKRNAGAEMFESQNQKMVSEGSDDLKNKNEIIK